MVARQLSNNSANLFRKLCVTNSGTKGTSESFSDSVRSFCWTSFWIFPTAQVSRQAFILSRCPFVPNTSRKRDEFRLPCWIKVSQETAQLAELTQSKAEVTLSASAPAAHDLRHWLIKLFFYYCLWPYDQHQNEEPSLWNAHNCFQKRFKASESGSLFTLSKVNKTFFLCVQHLSIFIRL